MLRPARSQASFKSRGAHGNCKSGRREYFKTRSVLLDALRRLARSVQRPRQHLRLLGLLHVLRRGEGQARWSFITAVGAIIVALTAPVLGAIADAGGRRKPWLAATYVIGVPAMMALWFATPGMQSGLMWIALAFILGNLFYEYSQIFANAMLPNIVPTSRIGFLSGAGLAVGNLSGILLFCFYLFAWSWNSSPLFGFDLAQHEPERAVGVLAG